MTTRKGKISKLVQVLVLCSSIFALFSLGCWTHQSEAATAPYVGPYLQNVRPDGITVMWETAEPAKGIVEYGLPERLDQRAKEDTPRTIHEIRLTGLTPGTTYAYRVLWDKRVTEVYSFETSPPPGTKQWRLVVYGDSRSNTEAHSAVVQRILEAEPDLVLNTGDLVSDGTQYDQWKPQFFEPLAPLMNRIPLFTTLGNHERNSEHYYSYVSLPNNEAWYSFDYGNAHLICLDSCQPFGPGSEQYQWLEADLEGAQADWVVAFFHHPMFSCHPTRDINANRWVWQPLFQQYGVDLVFTGHDHHYHRTYAIGSAVADPLQFVYHFTSGGGGASLYPVFEYPYTKAAVSAHHCVVLDFDGTVVHGRGIDREGHEIDRFVFDQSQPVAPAELIAWESIEWERALKDAIQALEPVPTGNSRATIQQTLSLPFTMPTRVTGKLIWATDSKAWQFALGTVPFELQPGQAWSLPLNAEADELQCYPVPYATLKITGGDFATEFRNREFVLQPLRVLPKRMISAKYAGEPPTLDGKLDDVCWLQAAPQTRFVRYTGEDLPAQQTRFRVAYDDATFYFAAEVETKERQHIGSGRTERDHGRILSRDESVLISVFVEDQLLNLGVNSRGTQYDIQDGELAWNPIWQAVIDTTDTGWNVEIAVPFAVFGGSAPAHGETVAFNVSRTEAERRERSQWSPCFGSWNTQSRFGTLHFE